MKIDLDVVSRRVEGDVWLRSFAARTAVFATRYYAASLASLAIRIEDAADGAIRCRVSAGTHAGPLATSAVASEVCAAVEEAVNRLEVALSVHLLGPNQGMETPAAA